VAAVLATTLTGLLAVAATAEEAPVQTEQVETSVRAAAVLVEAELVGIDLESREISLRGPLGQVLTMTVGEDVERLEEFAVGDIISATYLTSLAGELREPTEEEKANPWQVMEAAEIADGEHSPGVAGARMIHAVCTIEGMNRVLRTVMVEDPRGKYHVIEDVDPARLEGLTLGTTLILTYTEAMALSLEKRPLEAE
jgi:hypothetical protein